jgi:hypothetical protein
MKTLTTALMNRTAVSQEQTSSLRGEEDVVNTVENFVDVSILDPDINVEIVVNNVVSNVTLQSPQVAELAKKNDEQGNLCTNQLRLEQLIILKIFIFIFYSP